MQRKKKKKISKHKSEAEAEMERKRKREKKEREENPNPSHNFFLALRNGADGIVDARIEWNFNFFFSYVFRFFSVHLVFGTWFWNCFVFDFCKQYKCIRMERFLGKCKLRWPHFQPNSNRRLLLIQIRLSAPSYDRMHSNNRSIAISLRWVSIREQYFESLSVRDPMSIRNNHLHSFVLKFQLNCGHNQLIPLRRKSIARCTHLDQCDSIDDGIVDIPLVAFINELRLTRLAGI